MKILFTNPPWLRAQKHIFSKIKFSMPPLGLMQLASHMQGVGNDVKVLDNIGFKHSYDNFKRKIRFLSPDMVALTTSTSTINNALETARIVKSINPNTKVVFGGPHVSVLPEESLLNENVDYVVRGEGEKTFEELTKCLEKNQNVKGIKGLSFLHKKKVVNTPARNLIKNLDELPFPNRSLVPINGYIAPPGLALRQEATNMITSRGCPYSCVFCSNAVFGKTFRTNSPRRIVEEIRYLNNSFGFREIFFNDDVFTLNKKSALKFCKSLKKERMDVVWSCSTRADCLDAETVKAMKSSGCHTVGFGIESSEQKYLNRLQKDIKIGVIEKAIRLCKKEGLRVKVYYMIGYSKNVKKNVLRDLRHAIMNDVDFVKFSLITPYPGTKLYASWKKQGILNNEDWEKYDGSNLLRKDVRASEVREVYDTVYKKFYLRPSFLIKQLFKIKSWQELKNSFFTFHHLVKSN